MTVPHQPDDEAARLRDEVEQLRRQLVESDGDASDRRGWWRPLVAGILIGVAALLAPVSVLATWARDEIEDTDRYVETITPLASDPAIQDAIATKIEEVVFSYLDLETVTGDVVDALEEQGLSPRAVATLEAVRGPLANAIAGFVSDRIDALVQSDVFEQAWIEANRQAHIQMVAVLTGEGTETVDVAQGSVAVNIAALVGAVKDQLIDQGFAIASRIPEVDATFTIIESKDLANAQGVFSLLDGVATWLPVVALLMIAAAVMIARNRRRALLAAGLALAAAMLLLGAALNLARPIYLDAVPADSIPHDAAGVVYDTLVGFIRLALRAVLVIALAVAIAAWMWAPSGSGATARRGVARGVSALRSGRLRAGWQTGSLGVALARHRRAVRVGVIGATALVYVLRDHPTGGFALGLIITAVVLLILAEFLAAPSTSRASPPTPDTTETASARSGHTDE
jgi:hypothetical protein